MLKFLPSPIKGILAALFIVLNTVFWCGLIYPVGVVKFFVPHEGFRRACTEAIVFLGQRWIAGNSFATAFFHKIDWDVSGLDGLVTDKSYLVSANHQSWVDIVVLQHVLNGRIPFLRFFLKYELIFVPFLNGAWWALDFPFMKRYSKTYLEAHPEKRGKDLETTRKSCERFKGSKISLLNFLEGTRFTPKKHKSTQSTYKNLLPPKAGGIAFVLSAMGEQFDSFIDVTIHYPDGAVSLWDLLSGRVDRVVVRIQRSPIPRDLLNGDYDGDEAFRIRAQAWVRSLWASKDALIDRLKADKEVPRPQPN